MEALTPFWAFLLGCAAVLFVVALMEGKRR